MLRVLLLCSLANLAGCGSHYSGQAYFVVCYPETSEYFRLRLQAEKIAVDSPADVLTVVAPADYDRASEILREEILQGLAAVLMSMETPSPGRPRVLFDANSDP